MLNLEVICPFYKFGCNWQGRFEQYQQHVESCDFAMATCVYCEEMLHKNQLVAHSQTCPKAPKECPLSALGCTLPATGKDKLQQHMEESASEHLVILAKKMQSLEDKIKQRDNDFKENVMRKDIVDADGAMPFGQSYVSGIDSSLQSLPPQPQRKIQLVARIQNREVPSSAPHGSENDIHTIIEFMLTERLTTMQEEMRRSSMAELRSRDEEIAELKTMIKKLERTIQSRSAVNGKSFSLPLATLAIMY